MELSSLVRWYLVIWIKQEQTWNIRLYWSEKGTYLGSGRSKDRTWEQTGAKRWNLREQREAKRGNLGTDRRKEMELKGTDRSKEMELGNRQKQRDGTWDQAVAKMELGNRQEQSVHLRLIRQEKDTWDQTGATCSLEVNKTGERYLG